MALPLSTRDRLKADGLLLVITALWGGTFVVVKDSLDLATPFVFLALRFLLAAIVVAAVAGRDLLHGPSVRHGLLLGVFLFLGFGFQTVGLEHTTPSRSAFITGLSVILVPFVAVALFRRWPRVPSLAGVVLAVVGMYWLTLSGSAEARAGTGWGDLLTLACAFAYACQIALTERFAPGAKVATLVATQLAVVSLLSFLCVPLFGFKLELRPLLVWGIVFTGLFASAFAILVQTWAQQRTTAVRAALIFALEPVFAALYSVLVGRERLGAREVVGGGLIVLGVVVAEVGTVLWDRRAARAA